MAQARIALEIGNISSLYDIFDVEVPKKICVAMYLIKQFEAMEYDWDVVKKEEDL